MKKSAQKVASVNLGSKRICPKCGTKFYDFGKTDELECPKCQASVDVESTGPKLVSIDSPKKASKPKDLNEEVLVEEDTGSSEAESEFESLEDLEEDEDDLVDNIDPTEGDNEGGDF